MDRMASQVISYPLIHKFINSSNNTEKRGVAREEGIDEQGIVTRIYFYLVKKISLFTVIFAEKIYRRLGR